MSRTTKFIIAILGVIAVLDAASAVIASRITGSDKPPAAAVVAIALFAVLDLLGMYGLSRGARWAAPLIYVTRGLNAVSNLLGLGNHPTTAPLVIGSLTFGLSVVVVVALIAVRRQTSARSVDVRASDRSTV
jgi:uncharacterized membrane protein (DUF2068 family)